MVTTEAYDNFVAEHKHQLLPANVPVIFWPSLYCKLINGQYDVGEKILLNNVEYDEDEEKTPYDPDWGLIASKDIQCSDASNIFLIDHAWTFQIDKMRDDLRSNPSLLVRMCKLVHIAEDSSMDNKIESVYKKIWKYMDSYTVLGGTPDSTIRVWYVKDEVGSAMTHSDNPNFRAVPFMYTAEQAVYTIIYPVKDVLQNEIITKNFIEHEYSNPKQRDAMLIPFRHYGQFNAPFTQQEPEESYFVDGHTVESLPNLKLLSLQQSPEKLKVYSEYKYINEYLTSPDFEIVDNADEADVLWYLSHFKTYKELSEENPNKFINQFPFEYLITVKDLLAIVSRRYDQTSVELDPLETYPIWLPTTFNLADELPKLASYYMAREKAGLNNLWICKPYNLARGLDTFITDNLNFMCRLPLSGPKIAQKYLENPVLFDRHDIGMVKFDVRYVILLTSVDPTEVYIYSNFFLRFSNKAFCLSNFDDYEKHFTVMNYNNALLYRLMAKDFVDAWNVQYPDFNWSDVEKKIFNMFREFFTAATSGPPPRGIAKSPQSRALYASDIMLSWQNIDGKMTIQPKLLEINWMPDCQRACVYYPDFYNDVFSRMFLNKEVDTCVKIL